MIDFHVVYQVEAPNGRTFVHDTFLQLGWTPGSTADVIALKKIFKGQLHQKEPGAVNVFILSYYPIL